MQYKNLKLGLDIGTNSVGFALVDENNNVVKKNGKELWGVRLFDESKDKKERRSFRNQRRRLQRRKQRIELLRELFNNDIKKVDKDFFTRLNESFYLEDDKTIKSNIILEGLMSNSEYFKKYPTIFHLRDELYNSKEKADIRLIYLAIHHIIKYRGNFLNEGEKFEKTDYTILINIFKEFSNILQDTKVYFESLDIEEALYVDYLEPINDEFITDDFFNNIKEILTSDEGKRDKENKLKEMFENNNINKQSIYVDLFIKLLLGSEINLSKLKPVKYQNLEDIKINPLSETLQINVLDASDKVKDLKDIVLFIPKLNLIRQHFFLLKILGDCSNISKVFIGKYTEHHEDLKNLKYLYNVYLKDKYNDMFRNFNEKNISYSNYISFIQTNGKYTNFAHKTNKVDLYKHLKKELESIVTNNESDKNIIDKILFKIENDDFLVRTNSSDNSVIPYQLHKEELEVILENQKKYYPFLTNVTDGLTTIEKIISILEYKIPYYLGPLNSKSKYAWIVRNSYEKILPWNINEVVNEDETAINFIQRMQRRCTYLKGENDICLSKGSIIYQTFLTYTYINKIKINNSFLTYEQKEDLFKNLFLIKEKPNKDDIIKFFIDNYGSANVRTTKKELPELNASMQMYVKLKSIFNYTDDQMILNLDLLEDIIKDITVFEDKKLLEKRLSNKYNLHIEVVKKLKSFNVSGYCNLSKHLLYDLKFKDLKTNKDVNLIDVLKVTNYNLMEILNNSNYTLQQVIDEYNKDRLKNNEEDINDFLDENIIIQPIFRRPIIQAYKIIEELRKIVGKDAIKYYCIESTRTNQADKKIKDSRYKFLCDLYSSIEDLKKEYPYLEKELNLNKDNLRSEKLFLYFTQLGKCAYSLERIDLNDLLSRNSEYDVDHIYPQALICDNSMSNKILVKKTLNNRKQDTFLYETGYIKDKHKKFFEYLYNNNLISKEKYQRLIETSVDEQKLYKFVNRQLNTTNVACKVLKDVLKLKDNIEDHNIIFSKAENISDFRKADKFDKYEIIDENTRDKLNYKYEFLKSRLANNYHHAHDAYLNAVCGLAIAFYYRSIRNIEEIKNKNTEKRLTINQYKILLKDRTINNQVIWKKQETLDKIYDYLKGNHYYLITKKMTEQNQLFAKSGLVSKNEKDKIKIRNYTPNGNEYDVDKYGGINSNAYGKSVLIKYNDKKGKNIYQIINIPNTCKNKVNKEIEENNIKNYLIEQGYKDAKIILNDIKTNTVFRVIDKEKNLDYRFILRGFSADTMLYSILFEKKFNYEAIKIIKKIEKYVSNKASKVAMEEKNDYIIIQAKTEKSDEIELSKKELYYLLNEYCNIFKNSKLYGVSTVNSVVSLVDNFINNVNSDISIVKLLEATKSLLELFRINENNPKDLIIFGGSKNQGSLRINTKLNHNIEIYSYSTTGFYSKLLFKLPTE